MAICKYGCARICAQSCPFANYEKIAENEQKKEALQLLRKIASKPQDPTNG